jgi:hypothetical protein
MMATEVKVPLDEHEERILSEMERTLREADPRSARRLSSASLPHQLGRHCGWAGGGLLAGLIILLVSFATDWVVAAFGFLLMVASTVVIVQNLRRIGRHGIDQLARTSGARSLGEAVEEAARRLRRRFGAGE